MACEPINIFSRRIDVRGVIAVLRKIASDVKVSGPEDDWEQLIVYGPKRLFGRRLQLVFGHDSEYYDGPDWPLQVNGMANYFSAFPEVPHKAEILRAIRTFRFSLAFPEANLDIDGTDDRRAWVFAVCRHLDGVIFTPSSLRDASGRILISASGAFDPEAALPKVPPVAAEEAPAESASELDEDREPVSPTAERVARRALVLALVCNRGLIENEQENFDDPDGIRRQMLDRIDEVGIGDELEPEEWKVLQRPIGTLEQQALIDAVWRIEGLGVLSWALGRYQLPAYDQLVVPPQLFDALGCFQSDAARALLASSQLRAGDELEQMQTRILAYHWRMRDFSVRPQAMDFVAFSKKCWFGSFDLTSFRILENDLAIGSHPIAKADADLISMCQSAANERHQAINWLLGYSELYSETDTST